MRCYVILLGFVLRPVLVVESLHLADCHGNANNKTWLNIVVRTLLLLQTWCIIFGF